MWIQHFYSIIIITSCHLTKRAELLKLVHDLCQLMIFASSNWGLESAVFCLWCVFILNDDFITTRSLGYQVNLEFFRFSIRWTFTAHTGYVWNNINNTNPIFCFHVTDVSFSEMYRQEVWGLWNPVLGKRFTTFWNVSVVRFYSNSLFTNKYLSLFFLNQINP